MKIGKEFNIFLFSIKLLLKRKSSYYIFLILMVLVFFIASASFITASIKKELILTHEELPDIVIQRVIGGRQQYIPMDYIDKIVSIPGIKSILPRVWGYYYFDYSRVNFSIVGIDPLEPFYKKSLEENIKHIKTDDLIKRDDWMILGNGVRRLFSEIGYVDYAYFKKPNGEYIKLLRFDYLTQESAIFTNDIILISQNTARKLLGMDDDYVSDIVVNVYNKNEVVTIAAKIRDILKDARTVTKKDILNSYQNVFNYKFGFFITLFGVLVFTMMVIVIDKLGGLSETEKLEIGVLKATGWTTSDVLRLKFYESSFLVLQAFIIGVLLAVIYVYILKAPIMMNIFSGYASLKTEYQLIFAVDFKTLFLIFIAIVPFYIAAIIIPTYRIATLDTYEVFK
ncbi:ABC transporter permease [Calditerrivibrio sp.]|uniref:ABC transporter permease n=1 Tax=Calditerrivibrio sp. TaxID=2792612 RepID=UPI003D121F3A